MKNLNEIKKQILNRIHKKTNQELLENRFGDCILSLSENGTFWTLRYDSLTGWIKDRRPKTSLVGRIKITEEEQNKLFNQNISKIKLSLS